MKKINGRYVGQVKTPMFGKLRLKADGTIATAEVASKNIQTPVTMAHRLLWSNIIANYRVLKEPLREGWENIPQGQSLYTQFVSVNSRSAAYALTKEDFQAGACIVVPYQVTRGSLDPIKVSTTKGVALATTNIAVGDLTIDDSTTISAFAKAIVDNNSGWQYGDKLTYISMVQYVKSGVPKAAVSYAAITLLEESDVILADEVSLNGLANVGGVLGHDSAAPIGGFCYVHSRHDHDGKLLLSSQRMVVNNDDMIARYTSIEARLAAAKSYGADFSGLVVLEPSDLHVREAYEFFGIKFADALGETTITPEDVTLSGFKYAEKFVFDGDRTLVFDTKTSSTVVLTGSNFNALNLDTMKVIIDGQEISGAILDGNSLTATIPASLNGKTVKNITVTDGTHASSIDLTA